MLSQYQLKQCALVPESSMNKNWSLTLNGEQYLFEAGKKHT